MPVSYNGSVPTPSAAAARSSSPARCKNGTFVGEPESLITKCPSKFTTNASESRQPRQQQLLRQ